MDLNISYLPVDNYRNIALQEKITLVRSAWRVLFALAEGQTTLSTLIKNLGMKEAHLESRIDELIENKLIKEQTMTIEDFENSLQGAIPITADQPGELKEKSSSVNVDKNNRAFDLKKVTDYIVQSGGKGRIGQLAAHRVFLKIPPNILKNAGIASLDEIGKDVIIKDDSLKAEIIKATKLALKKDIPDEVFFI